MRYFGKEGPQCRPVCDCAQNSRQKARLLARSVLFGRVPRKTVMWLGMGEMVFTFTLVILCLNSSLKCNVDDFHRDMTTSVLINR